MSTSNDSIWNCMGIELRGILNKIHTEHYAKMLSTYSFLVIMMCR